jgi:predicted MPP superfamily phosphohydrolase
MKKMKKILLSLSLVVLLMSALGAWVFIESTRLAPQRLRVVRVQHIDAQLPQAFDGVRLVYLSDVHWMDASMPTLERIVETVETLRPDVILFGGNLISANQDTLNLSEEAQLLVWLSRLHAPLGKFATWGEFDRSHQTTLERLYELSQFTLLNQTTHQLHHGQAGFIQLAALTPDAINLNALNLTEGVYTLLLAYDPKVLESPNLQAVNLILSAKVHGGQITLPVYGPLYEPARGRPHRGYALNQQPAYLISNGLATLEPRARWLSDPSLYVIELKKQP